MAPFICSLLFYDHEQSQLFLGFPLHPPRKEGGGGGHCHSFHDSACFAADTAMKHQSVSLLPTEPLNALSKLHCAIFTCAKHTHALLI